MTPELSKILIDNIFQCLAGQLCAVLYDLDMAGGIDNIAGNIPESRIAKKICLIVEETGRTHYLSETGPIPLHKACRFSADQGDERIRVLALILGGQGQGREHQSRDQTENRPESHQSFLNFSAQTSRVNEHSRYMGSMMIYVSLIFLSRNLLIASICLPCLTWARIWL